MSESLVNRVMCALSYLTAGIAGLLYGIFLYLTNRRISNFVRFNIMQSIFFALLLYIIALLFANELTGNGKI